MVRNSSFADIKVITFDGDMTLWDFQSAMKSALYVVLNELRRKISNPAMDVLSVAKLIEIRNQTAMRLKGQVQNLEEIRLQAFSETLKYLGVTNDLLVAEINEIYLKHRFNNIELYPDVLPTLLSLKNKYKLGLISNGNTYPERCGLPYFFTFTLFAHQIGIEKPDPGIFLKACELGDCQPHSMLHIGDSLQDDIFGAQQTGIYAIWLNREYLPHDKRIIPDYEIHTLSSLLKVLP